ncbi:MAG: hypothetical protein ABGY24_00165, partial [bacterium]
AWSRCALRILGNCVWFEVTWFEVAWFEVGHDVRGTTPLGRPRVAPRRGRLARACDVSPAVQGEDTRPNSGSEGIFTD